MFNFQINLAFLVAQCELFFEYVLFLKKKKMALLILDIFTNRRFLLKDCHFSFFV